MIPWFLKQRIRINPNVIYRLKKEDITDEVVDFALSQSRFSFSELRYSSAIFNNEKFVSEYINSSEFNKNI